LIEGAVCNIAFRHAHETPGQFNAPMPAGFHFLIAAQFAAGLADNALLIVTIALLQGLGYPPWWAPMLKFSFMASYVVLAPWMGPLADAFPKARLMGWMNALKLAAVALLLAGAHPLLCFALAGLGAAAYAPAKYGLMTELVRPAALVRANGWIEVSMVCSVLLGTVLGGALAGHWMPYALHTLLAIYAVAGLLNWGIPESGCRYAPGQRAMVRDFFLANRTLWKDRQGGLSMAVTTLFWGAGATVQIAVLRWAELNFDLPISQGAYLQALVALGVVIGAVLAARHLPLSRATRVLPAGVLLGLALPLLAWCTHLPTAWALLVAVGAAGGLLVVPMNALLQHRGLSLLTAGRSIAVQGFNENASVLVMMGVYASLLQLEVPLHTIMSALGLCLAAGMAWLLYRARGNAEREAQCVAEC
jgi:LPLT family lysophospholipid transporter-like MFS transporter